MGIKKSGGVVSGGAGGLVTHSQTFLCSVPTPIVILAGEEFNLFNATNGLNSLNGSTTNNNPSYKYTSSGNYIKAPTSVGRADMLIRFVVPATATGGSAPDFINSVIRRPLVLGDPPQAVPITISSHTTSSRTEFFNGFILTNHDGATDPYKLFGFGIWLFNGGEDVTITGDYRLDIVSVFQITK